MSASARHLEGSVPVLEEEQGAPLCNLAGPKFTHGFQVSLVESFVESLIRLQGSTSGISQLCGRSPGVFVTLCMLRKAELPQLLCGSPPCEGGQLGQQLPCEAECQ